MSRTTLNCNGDGLFTSKTMAFLVSPVTLFCIGLTSHPKERQERITKQS